MKRNKNKRLISKKTQYLLLELQRRRGVRELKKRFLIVCEDGKSAPNYFESLKRHFGLSATSVEVTGSDGKTQPIQVVEKALSLKSVAMRKSSGTIPFEQVWCIIDGDYGEKIAPARSLAIENNIELAISTQCFEYWILLHFEENDSSAVECDELVSRLSPKHMPKYEKGKCNFDNIVYNVSDACVRAEKLRKPGIARNDRPEVQNPCSEVYKLINAILDARSEVK